MPARGEPPPPMRGRGLRAKATTPAGIGPPDLGGTLLDLIVFCFVCPDASADVPLMCLEHSRVLHWA